MKNIIKKVPVPLCGVMLGMAALGNLLQSYSEALRYICGVVAGLLLILVLLKVILFPKMIAEDMKNPIMASVAATFPMALMLLSVYVKPFISQGAYFIWLFALALHVVLMVYFTLKFVVKLELPKVFASYYIVYVGIAAGSITAPTYESQGLGTVLVWFALASLAVLLVLVTLRYVKSPVPEAAKPLICIYAAPTSLCIAGYIQSVGNKSQGLLLGLLVIATVLYLFGLVKAVGYLKLPFYPSYAAFTFPFVITAIATKQAMACLANMGNPQPWLGTVVLVETIIATAFTLYTLVRFVQFTRP